MGELLTWLSAVVRASKETKVQLRDYELVMLISPQVADDQVSGVVDRVTGYIKERGGAIAEVKPWGRRRLAYHIKDFQEANYVQANFALDPQNARELESTLGLTEEVIRHLLVQAGS